MNTSLYGDIIEIGPDGQPITPTLILANRNGEKKGAITNVKAFTDTDNFNEAAEITFDVYKTVDNKKCEFWDDIKDFRLIYIPHRDSNIFNPWYELKVDMDENDATVKHCIGTHLHESELSQLTLNNIEINSEDDIMRDDYVPTVLYNPDKPEGSLLHRILKDKAGHYTIWHVDPSIAKLQRTFSWDGVYITDAFNDIAEEIECLFKFGESLDDDGKIHRTISVYDLDDQCSDCGERGTFKKGCCTKCGSTNINPGYGSDSGIFINHENFADEISYSSNKDEVKNCFYLKAGDDLMTATVRNLSPTGSSYIWYLNDSTRNDMSTTLRNKLDAYDKKCAEYSDTKQMNISEQMIKDYNALITKYQVYDKELKTVSYPIKGYSSMIGLYYEALDLYYLLQTSLAPASDEGAKITAEEEIKKLTVENLSPIGIQNASKSSLATINTAIENYVKVYINTGLYRITVKNNSYSNMVWKGTISLDNYSNEGNSDDDKATTPELTLQISEAKPDYLKSQIEKAMKKGDPDAIGTLGLFKITDKTEFKKKLAFYSVDNLNELAKINRSCLDILIEKGTADPSDECYESIYLPYYNKSLWLEDELKEREAEVTKLQGDKENPTGLLDIIDKLRTSIINELNLQKYLADECWIEFCSFRRDDIYQNDNFISDGLSDQELIDQAKEFRKNAEKEIEKSATLQNTITCNLNNLLLVCEKENANIITLDGVYIVTDDQKYLIADRRTFSPIIHNFEVGNWIHVEIDETIYKLRLTSYKIDYDNLQTLNVEFSDVICSSNYFSDTQSILSKAQSIATSYNSTKRQANKGETANKQLSLMVDEGLSLTNKKIVSAANNQSMLLDETGMLMREKNEFGDGYSMEQTKVINHGIYYTNDNWKTVQTGLGKFMHYDPDVGEYVEDYGLIAHKIVGDIILGNEVKIYNDSGSLKMTDEGFVFSNSSTGNKFVVNPKNDKKMVCISNKKEDTLWIDDTGLLHVNGDGAGLDLSFNKSITGIDNRLSENGDIGMKIKANSEGLEIVTNDLKDDGKIGSKIIANAEGIKVITESLGDDGDVGSKIIANARQIQTVVGRLDENGDIGTQLTSFKQTQDAINLSFQKKTDENGNEKNEYDIISSINVNESGVQIQGDKINLVGTITANSYFVINDDGTMSCKGGKIGGWTIGEDGLTCEWGNTTEGGNKVYILNGSNTNHDFLVVYDKKNNNWPFFVRANGYVFAQNCSISGNITATTLNLNTDSNYYVGEVLSAYKNPNGNDTYLCIGKGVNGISFKGQIADGSDSVSILDGHIHCNSMECKTLYTTAGIQMSGAYFIYMNGRRTLQCSRDNDIWIGGNKDDAAAGNCYIVVKNVYKTSSGSNTSLSDERFKTDISSIPNAEEFIMNLSPKIYKFTDGTSNRYHTGFLAQDVKNTMDNTIGDFGVFVRYTFNEETPIDENNPDTYICGLRYEELMAPHIQVTQNHQRKILELENKVEKLSKEIQELRSNGI